MNRTELKISLFALVAVGLLALPAGAQVIPAGADNWVTPGDGLTFFTFPPGDVESLCNKPPSSDWDRRTSLRGVPSSGADWDTQVVRLKDADLSDGSATVPIQVRQLHFASSAPHCTPCGTLRWRVKATEDQPETEMTITRSSENGGTFEALISVNVEFTAISAGTAIGSLHYTMDLPDPGGTPWTFGGPTGWRPGIDEGENCIEILRKKISTLPAFHAYFIEQMIAEGRCDKRPNA